MNRRSQSKCAAVKRRRGVASRGRVWVHAREAGDVRGLWRWYRSRRARTQWVLGILSLFAVLIVIGSLAPDPEQPAPADRAAKTPVASATPTTAPKATAVASKPRGSSRNALVALDTLRVK